MKRFGAIWFYVEASGGGVKKELNKFLCTKGETPGGDTSCYVHSVTPGLCAVWNAVMLSKIALLGSSIFSFSVRKKKKSQHEQQTFVQFYTKVREEKHTL